ncbi:MAG: type II toxin-antitoxin system VapC family toxin [Actinomycetota bacterium]
MALVLDTGVILAALNEDDPDHVASRELLEDTREPLIVPTPILVEVDYWLRKLAGVDIWLTFCEEIDAGAYTMHSLDTRTLMAAVRLQVQYADNPIGFVDAAVAATCEALGERKIATLDHRHFGVIRLGDRPLEIVPS